MGGRASLIMVIGFAVIFAFINFNLARLTNTAAENMVGYNQIALSRNMASAGANVGLAMLTYKNYPHNRHLSAKTFTSGEFAGCGYTVRIDSVKLPKPHLLMKSVSACTTYLFTDSLRSVPLVLRDTVEVRFDYTRRTSFSSFGWLTQIEGNVFFTTGDTLWGKVHSNGNIHIDGKPVFWGKTTTSGKFDPVKNSGVFKGGKETGVEEKPFPTDLSELQINATNNATTRTSVLYVDLKPGTSGNDDGYALISTGGYLGSGGSKVDSIRLSDWSNNVIWSSENVHVKGTLDGRLSVASGENVIIDGNIRYERKPDPANPDLNAPANQTRDMLGLVATNDVIIPSTYTGTIEINGSVFAKDGSFMAEKWNQSHGGEWRINLIGSICQKTRGAVGQTNGNGYKKSYRFDPRFADETNDEAHPPSFPGYDQPSTLHVQNWWESPRVPIDVSNYY